MSRIFNIELAMYLCLDKEHTLWDYMPILVRNGPIYHTQHLTMDLESLSLNIIITDRHIVCLMKKQTQKMKLDKHTYLCSNFINIQNSRNSRMANNTVQQTEKNVTHKI